MAENFYSGALVSIMMTERTLVVESRNGGFFSNFNCVMSNLAAYLGRDGCIAAEVDWRARPEFTHFVYGTPEDGNIWLHFFAPPQFSVMPQERFYVSEYTDKIAGYISAQDAYVTHRLNPFWRQRYQKLFDCHIKVKPFITARVNECFAAGMDGRFCLGVHYRNPRHAVECLKPIPPPETFIARARRLLPRGKPAVVFLASDYAPAVTAFRDAFGVQLVLQPDVNRADAALPDQLHHGLAEPGLAMGEQVLTDCLLLAKCDVLLHVTSNVATAAAYINPKLKLVYCETRLQSWQNFIWAVLRVIEWRNPDGWEPAKAWRRWVAALSTKPLPVFFYRLFLRLLG